MNVTLLHSKITILGAKLTVLCESLSLCTQSDSSYFPFHILVNNNCKYSHYKLSEMMSLARLACVSCLRYDVYLF